MKRAVRYKNKMVPLKKHAQRRDQFAVERFQMALRSPQERRFESLHIVIAHTEFGNLKPQQLKEMSHAGKHRNWQNSCVITRDNSGNQLLARNKVFDERSVLWQATLEFFERKVCGRFEGCVFALVRRQLSQGAQDRKSV